MRRFVRVEAKGGARVGGLDGDDVELLDHDDPLAALRGAPRAPGPESGT